MLNALCPEINDSYPLYPALTNIFQKTIQKKTVTPSNKITISQKFTQNIALTA